MAEAVRVPVEAACPYSQETCCVICKKIRQKHVLPCGHVFCAPCIGEWLNVQSLADNRVCPMCRRPHVADDIARVVGERVVHQRVDGCFKRCHWYLCQRKQTLERLSGLPTHPWQEHMVAWAVVAKDPTVRRVTWRNSWHTAMEIGVDHPALRVWHDQNRARFLVKLKKVYDKKVAWQTKRKATGKPSMSLRLLHRKYLVLDEKQPEEHPQEHQPEEHLQEQDQPEEHQPEEHSQDQQPEEQDQEHQPEEQDQEHQPEEQDQEHQPEEHQPEEQDQEHQPEEHQPEEHQPEEHLQEQDQSDDGGEQDLPQIGGKQELQSDDDGEQDLPQHVDESRYEIKRRKVACPEDLAGHIL